jgi:hypothetical protein
MWGRRRRAHHDDAEQTDSAWLNAGQQRYKAVLPRHLGSPETIAAGGAKALQDGDVAAALFLFQKAIDLLHTQYDYFGMQRRTPGAADEPIIDGYLETLSHVRLLRPEAPVTESVMEATHRLRTISTACQEAGIDPSWYLASLQRLADLAPDVDVTGIFWKNPGVGT